MLGFVQYTLICPPVAPPALAAGAAAVVGAVAAIARSGGRARCYPLLSVRGGRCCGRGRARAAGAALAAGAVLPVAPVASRYRCSGAAGAVGVSPPHAARIAAAAPAPAAVRNRRRVQTARSCRRMVASLCTPTVLYPTIVDSLVSRADVAGSIARRPARRNWARMPDAGEGAGVRWIYFTATRAKKTAPAPLQC